MTFFGLIDCVVLYLKVRCFYCSSYITFYIEYVLPEESPIYDTNKITNIVEKVVLLINMYPDCLLSLEGDLNVRTKTILDCKPAGSIDFLFNL